MRTKSWYSQRIMNNLLRTYNRASEEDFQEGMKWYTHGHLLADSLAKRWGFETRGVCGVIAALSPGRQWELNLEDAGMFLEEFKKGARGRKLPSVGSYGNRNLNKVPSGACWVKTPGRCSAGIR